MAQTYQFLNILRPCGFLHHDLRAMIHMKLQGMEHQELQEKAFCTYRSVVDVFGDVL